MRTAGALLTLFLASGVAFADPPAPAPAAPPAAASPPAKPAPLTPEQAADAALAAIKAKDDAGLKALAAKDEPDPWLVADELIRRGEFDAADSFAKAAPRVDVEKLPAYVASRRGASDEGAARSSLEIASQALAARNFKDALAALGPPDATPLADVVAIRRAVGRGVGLRALGRLEESGVAFAAAAEAAERVGWLSKASRAFHDAGMVAHRRSDFRGALLVWARRLGMAEARADHAGLAATLNNMGAAHASLGAYPKALEAQERSLRLTEGLGDRAGVAATLGNIGNVHQSLGNYAKALEYDERALQMMEGLGDRTAVARTLGNIGNVHASLGSYPKALEYQERALAMKEQLGDRVGASATLRNLGSVHAALGNHERALEYDERALKASEALGDRAGVAATLGNMGNIHQALGNYSKALACQERALKLGEDLGDRPGIALTLGNLGNVHDALGNRAKARGCRERALTMSEELGDREGVAVMLGNLGVDARESGDLARSSTSLERAAREAERIRADALLAWTLGELARTQLTANELSAALLNAKRAIPLLERMLGGLAEEQGARARGRHANLFGVGALAAARKNDPAEVTYFLESGRAGSLMESLGGRQALRWQSLPEELRRADADARAAESVALAHYTRALDGSDRAEIRSRLDVLDAARERVREVVERIQREAKKAASVSYPRAATLEEIEGWLRGGEALVLYGFCLDEVLAMVLTKHDARIVLLGKASEVTAACEALDLRDAEADPQPALATLRRLIVAPLALKDDVTRVLVSPEGSLSYAPMALLFEGREVAYEPSGTTYGLLIDDREKHGDQVLALGDPDYAAAVDSRALEIYARAQRGRRLAPLPGTRKEAVSVGDVTLLGRDASEAGLRAAIASKRERWHAVHLACHGLVDPERPTLSSLALTPDAENDGFFTAPEVLRTEIPADLVVLSACETGRGKVVKGEGIVGLTRAFMFAGAPRVICSLWKVDDEATRALMVRFYELWNPKGGKPGLPTAEALRKAQEFVRGHEKWKHPYYWAAWVLWGLPS